MNRPLRGIWRVGDGGRGGEGLRGCAGCNIFALP